MRCKKCGTNKFDISDMKKVDGYYICPECFYRYYKSCEVCGKLFEWNSVNQSICDKCDSKVYERPINNYSTKPRPRFINYDTESREDLGRRYYGLEMEFSYVGYDNIYHIAKELYDDKIIYNKSDSSLRSGVEIVTNPLDKKSIVRFLERMDGAFKFISQQCDYKSNAGIHIHVNKRSIEPIDRYKLNILLNMTSTLVEKSMLLYLSGRKEDTSIDITGSDYCTVGSTQKWNYKSSFLDRHIALNVKPKDTFEFRIFKTSTDKDTIMSYVDMVDSMVEFCHNNGLNDINLSNYFIYLKSTTKNKILLDKLLKFENDNSRFKKIKNIIASTNIKEMIKNKMKWYEYYKLLSYISTLHFNNTRELYNGIITYLENKDVVPYPLHRITVRCEISYWLMKEYRAELINKIMKGVA